jgi:carbonic anhydrase
MSSATVGAVVAENCGQCGGNWLGAAAFGKLSGMRPSDGRHISCPSCRARMQTRLIQNQALDVCPSCGGTWSDTGELLAITGRDPERAIPLQDFRAFKHCPTCSLPMRVTVLDGVEIESCPKCKGVWLDSGELDRLGGFAMERGRRLFCPSCSVLMSLTVLRDVEIDYCTSCEGTWLDKGEVECLTGHDVVHTVQMEEPATVEVEEEFQETSVLEALVSNNAQFLQAKKAFSKPPHAQLGLVIITCIDPRLVGLVEQALGIAQGDAYFIKTAGPSAAGDGADIVRSAVVAVLMGEAKEILVLGHTDCAMTKLSSGKVSAAMGAAGLSEQTVRAPTLVDWMGGFMSERDNVLSLVKILRKSPLVPGSVLVHGAVIDTASGKLTVVSDGLKKQQLLRGKAE